LAVKIGSISLSAWQYTNTENRLTEMAIPPTIKNSRL
jgi:hypothetical protein